MNFQAICVANITGIVLIVSLLISKYITYNSLRAEDRIFTLMMHLVLFGCFLELLTFYVDGRPGRIDHWINLIGNTILYAINAYGSFLYCVYVDIHLYQSAERVKRVYKKLLCIVIALIAALILNIRLGFFFYVDADNVYHRNTAVVIFYIFTFLCCTISIVVLRIYRRRFGRAAFFPIYMYLIPIVTGSALQMLFYGVSLAWLGTAIGIVALYMSMLSRSSYLDSLTGLYNRLYLEHFMYRIKKKSSSRYYGIMIDMDDFKAINDNYGHSAGDQALKDAACIFRNAAPDRNTGVFRYAGDEFIIIIRADDEAYVKGFEDRLQSEAEKINKGKDRRYQIGFSMGHALYDRENDTYDTFLKKIDSAMYENKVQRKAGIRI